MKKAAIVLGKILLGILAFILCVALFVSTVLTVVVADVRIITDKDNINTLITGYLTGKTAPQRNPGISGMPLQEKAHRAPIRNLEEFDITMMGDTNFLVEYIYNTVKEEMGEELPLSLQDVQDFVEESTLDDFITEKASSLISDFITGENTTTITAEEIVEQLKQNAPLIEETFQIPLDDTVISELTDSLEESGILEELEEGGLEAVLDLANPPSGNDTVPEHGIASGDSDKSDSVQNAGSLRPNLPVKEKINLIGAIQGIISGELDLSKLSVPQLLNLFRSVISLETLLACIGLCAVLMGLVFLTQWKRYYSAMIKIGITLLVTGIICMVPAVIVWVAPELILSLLGDLAFAKKLIDMLVQMTYPVSAGIAVGGLALIIAGGILRGAAKKRAKAVVVAVQEAVEPEVTEELSQELLDADVCEEPVAEETEEAGAEETEEVPEETAQAVSEAEAPAEEEPVEA